MKLHYSKILLFFLPLNILETSYQAHNNNNEPYIIQHHTPTNRSLCECDKQSSNYDKDTGMKSVMQQFVDRTSQRFEEYDERMKTTRQKRKEQSEKNIEKIIDTDKREKSLAEKVEKCCLKCGCALGGGVLPVWGLVCGVGYAVWSQHATKLAIQKGIEKGIEVGLQNVMKIADTSSFIRGATMPPMEELAKMTTGISGDNVTLYDIFQCINSNTNSPLRGTHPPFFTTVKNIAGKPLIQFNSDHRAEAEAVANAFKNAKATEFAAKTGLLSNTIIASVVAIVVIVLIMVIIYLILRRRRKKKMKKKAEYTKLLNQ
ncbi:rifin PIR protein,putative [Plasmodium sp. DRC-Itaito]|nr:rifin PIR protein,putative [Plasmodium sp. DRC-Itaito]